MWQAGRLLFSLGFALGAFVFSFSKPSFVYAETVNGEDAHYQDKLAFEQVKQQLEDYPDNLELNFRYAQYASKLQDYEKAIAAMERMLIVNPNLHRIKLDLAALYLRVGSDIESEKLFKEVLDENPPAQVQQNIQKMLTYIESNRRKHFLSVAYSLGWNADSNLNANPSSGAVDVLGTSIATNTKKVSEGQLTSTLSVGHSYVLPSENKHRWQTQVTAYKSKQESSRDKDVSVVAVKTGPVFYSKDKQIQYGLSLGYEDTNLAHEDYLKAVSKEAFIRYLLTPTTQISGVYRHQNRMFKNSESVSTYENRNGCVEDFELQVRSLLSPKDILAASLAYRKEDTRVAYETNTSKALNVSYTHLYGDDLYFNASALVKKRTYDGSDILVNASKVRDDLEKVVTLGVGYNVTDNITCGLSVQRRLVQSNIQNYDYENDRLMGTITWRY